MRGVLQARVQNGRLVLDEPTDLPEGDVVRLVIVHDEDDGLSDEEREAMHNSLDRAIAQAKADRTIDGGEFLALIRARRT